MTSPSQRRADILNRFPKWLDCTIAGLFDLTASCFPERDAILTDTVTLNYRDVQARSRAIASGLIKLGLRQGDHVALVMANFPEFPLVKLAIARAGAVAVPINFALQIEEMRYVVEQSHSRFLIGMTQFRERDYGSELLEMSCTMSGLECVILRDAKVGGQSDALSLDGVASLGTPESDAELAKREACASGSNVSDIIYTSGTTGYPKGAILTHDMVLRAAFSSALTRSFEDGRRIQFALPMYHVFGYVECWVATMFVGGSIVPHAIFDAKTMLDWAENLQSNDMICVPLMTQALIDEASTRSFNAPKFRAFFNSGGVNHPSIWRAIREKFGVSEIHTAYGMTETTASAMCTATEDTEEKLITTNGGYKLAGPAGDPLIGGVVARYRVVDPETGMEVVSGVDGELQVCGPVVTKGYYDNPEETKAAFTKDGWLRTGDVGHLLEGGYLVLTGRIKETYRCGGEMVMPREIETLLEDYPGVAQVLAVGVPDSRMGEVGCLCIVPQPNMIPDLAGMIDLCKARLARFKVPRHAILLTKEEIPLTVTGRPQKFKLARIAADRVAAQVAGQALAG